MQKIVGQQAVWGLFYIEYSLMSGEDPGLSTMCIGYNHRWLCQDEAEGGSCPNQGDYHGRWKRIVKISKKKHRWMVTQDGISCRERLFQKNPCELCGAKVIRLHMSKHQTTKRSKDLRAKQEQTVVEEAKEEENSVPEN